MREIKFRVWDKDIKVFTEDEFFTVDDMKYDDPYVFMQYTGLKDKNGIEIYEGDILTCGNLNYKLVWEDGKACEIHNKEDKFSPRFLFNYLEQLEVIGNIYENKELLGD